MKSNIKIKNKKAYYEYEILEKVIAGIVLQGTEIKSIRTGKVSITEAYCRFEEEELFIVNLNISEYAFGTYNNHEPKRVRKLLLTRKELRKWSKKIKEKGFSIIPLVLFIDDNGFAKVQIALATGKRLYDKRHTIKEREMKMDLKRKFG